jgi:hypothetical protein
VACACETVINITGSIKEFIDLLSDCYELENGLFSLKLVI